MKRILFIILCLLVCTVLYSNDYYDFVDQKCKELNIPKDIVVSIITVESNWRNVRGTTGDIGFMQLNPYYIHYYKDKFWNKGYFDPWNPYHNIEVGIEYIAYLYSIFNDWELTIKAYNRGPNAVKSNKWAGEEYYFKVMKEMSNL